MRKLFLLAMAVTGLGACSDQLVSPNQNNPDVARVLRTPADVEQLIGNSFATEHNMTIGTTAGLGGNAGSGLGVNIRPVLMTMSFESSSSLANQGVGPRQGIPRSNTGNTRGNQYAAENANAFQAGQRNARTAATGLVRLAGPGFSLGNPAQDLRARAFAYFVMAVSNGDVALAYDSLSVVTENDTLDAGVKPLSGAKDAMVVVLAQLDSAIAASNRGIAAGGFSLPSTWINGNPLTDKQFIALARSWKARFRAGVARTPAERKAVDWTQVIADAQNGITSDLKITMSPTTPWTVGDEQHYTFDTWHQQSPMIIGMADSVHAGCSAANAGDQQAGQCYDAWIATPLNSRYAFLIKTADQRFPSGETRAAQRTSSGTGNFPVPTGNLYFRNRVVSDPAGDAWALSQYDYYRFQAFAAGGRSGPYPTFARAELDLLEAEGFIYKGDFASAMPLINITRVRNGLPALTGITSATQPIATGAAANSCVPRVPQAPSFTSAGCGNIMEAMKWEKRMETAYINYGSWFFDSRGWGDLPEGTPLEFPVPFQELDVRLKPFYSLGGIGGPSAAAKGTYGY